MPKVTLDIEHVAKLANLKLSSQEESAFEKQLSEILKYFENLNELNTEKAEPVSQITGLSNVKREDVAAPSFSQEEALSNVKRKYNGFVEVEAILEEQ